MSLHRFSIKIYFIINERHLFRTVWMGESFQILTWNPRTCAKRFNAKTFQLRNVSPLPRNRNHLHPGFASQWFYYRFFCLHSLLAIVSYLFVIIFWCNKLKCVIFMFFFAYKKILRAYQLNDLTRWFWIVI